jgi:tetratricopeptide (TPR) repeat protein
MSAALGTWLRQQREARSWTRREMARQLIEAGRAAGDKSMPGIDGMCHNIQRWESGNGGLTERYKLCYCKALGITAAQFGGGTAGPGPLAPVADVAMVVPTGPAAPGLMAQVPVAVTGQPDPGPLASSVFAYRGREESSLGLFAVEREVLMAAHEGSDHAAEHEQHGIGEATLEQLRADLARLSSLSDTSAPLSAFLEMRRVRDRIYRLLDRRLWPGEQADLYFLLGCINELMGLAANRLGYPDAAEELIRAGWAYANAIDHNPLRGMLRARLSYVMYWRGWYSESRDLAADGLRYTSQGLVGANLHLEHARALARLGDHDAARREVGLAHAARETDYSDDLSEIGGEEFALSRAATCSMAGGALAEVGDGREAAGELETAVSLYDAGPGPGEQHGVAGKALAGADLAVVRIRSGALDGAVVTLEAVLILPPAQRVSTLTARLARVRNELAAPVFRGSPQARDLIDRIEDFGREAVTAGLHSLSGLS